MTISGSLDIQSALTFNLEKSLGFELMFKNGAFSVKPTSSGKVVAPALTGSINGNLEAVANLIPSINVFVMGSPIRLRTIVQLTATGGMELKASTSGGVTACAKGDLGLNLALIFNFTWMI